MPIRDCPFISPHPNVKKKRPWLFIVIKNPKTGLYLPTCGLLDTEADECALPAAYAELLGHNLKDGEQKQIKTGNGVTTAYRHTCSIEILDTKSLEKNKLKTVYTIENTLIDFMPNLHCALLGVETFLNNFIVTIDYPRQVFSVIKPK